MEIRKFWCYGNNRFLFQRRLKRNREKQAVAVAGLHMEDRNVDSAVSRYRAPLNIVLPSRSIKTACNARKVYRALLLM